MADNPLPYHAYSTTDKARLALACARQRYFPRRNLIAGPFAGEFGYELMQWQAYVRGRRASYDQVHVITYPGREYLYEGCTVHEHEIQLKGAGYGYGVITPTEAKEQADALARRIGLTDYDVFDTSLLCTQYHKRLFWPQAWRLLEEPAPPEDQRDIVLHFRAVEKAGPDLAPKNYEPARADELAERLRARGWSLACIGHPQYSYCPPGCEDRRVLDLQATARLLTGARLFVGEMSGPVHLACLAGKPLVTWAEKQMRVDYALRWNPFQVPIHIATIATWQPDPALIAAETATAYEAARIKTRDFTERACTLPAQSIINY